MKTGKLLIFVLSILIISGCHQPSDKVLRYQENFEIIGSEKDDIIGDISDTIYESVDRANSDAEQVIIKPVLKDDKGVILPAGRYEITGEITGNVYVRDEHKKLLFHDIVGGFYGVGRITIDVNGSHVIQVDGFDQVFINPVPTQPSTELHAGIWEVGKDIEAGDYSANGFGFGYLQLFEEGEKPRVFEIVGEPFVLQLKNGQKLKINGVSMVNFDSRGKSQ